jgi:hypothetical protein
MVLADDREDRFPLKRPGALHNARNVSIDYKILNTPMILNIIYLYKLNKSFKGKFSYIIYK